MVVMNKYISVACYIIAVLLIIYFIEFRYPVKGDYEILISKNIPTSVAAKDLEKQGFIRDDFSFVVLSRLFKWDKNIKAGKYKLSKPLPTFRLLYAMVYNSLYVLEYPITVKEGATILEIAKELSTIEVDTSEFLGLVLDPSFFSYLRGYFPKLDATISLEGYLYPETYKFFWAEDPQQVIWRMVYQLFAVIPDSFYDRMEEINMSLNQTLTLASIIEKEAQVDFERPLISAVFHNRLRLRRPLESNVTLEYYLNQRKAWLKFSETRIETPYNTYRYSGLPPTPICSPSIASITAALYPAKVNYLYFVAKGDGTHYFSKTFSEHKLNVMKVRSLFDVESTSKTE